MMNRGILNPIQYIYVPPVVEDCFEANIETRIARNEQREEVHILLPPLFGFTLNPSQEELLYIFPAMNVNVYIDNNFIGTVELPYQTADDEESVGDILIYRSNEISRQLNIYETCVFPEFGAHRVRIEPVKNVAGWARGLGYMMIFDIDEPFVLTLIQQPSNEAYYESEDNIGYFFKIGQFAGMTIRNPIVIEPIPDDQFSSAHGAFYNQFSAATVSRVTITAQNGQNIPELWRFMSFTGTTSQLVIQGKIMDANLPGLLGWWKDLERYVGEHGLHIYVDKDLVDDYKALNETIAPYVFSDEVIPDPPGKKPMIKHNQYLYEAITPSDVIYDYTMAKRYFDTNFKPSVGLCSSFVAGNVYARNLDWTYDDSLQFVYRTEARTGRFASISVVDSDSHITEKNIDIYGSGGYYDILPFKCTDGINERGVFCNINVVPGNETGWIPTTGTNPDGEDMCMLMICRWVLDNCSSAAQAVSELSNFNIYAPALEDLPYEFHFMIGDAEDVYIVDFVNNTMEVTYVGEESGELPAIMTNFRNANTTLDASGHIDYTTVSEYGQGLERYNLIADNISDIHTVADALDFMSTDLKYTNSYDLTNNRITEFVGNGLTVEDAYLHPELFNSIRATAANMYANRSRDKSSPNFGTRQTTHTAVYDISTKNLKIKNQEGDDTYTFSIPEHAESTYLCFTANTSGSTVQLTKIGSPTEVSLEISTNGTTRTDYTIGNTITLTNVGDKVYMRNKSETPTGFSTSFLDHYQFVMGGSISASGDVNFLLCKNSTNALSTSCYRDLFAGCASLATAPELPANTLADNCYGNMFEGCTSLNTAPELPATTLANFCYDQMFQGCTGLTTTSELPSTTLVYCCYELMFNGCTSLTTAPELPATTLADYCYYGMFAGCTSLTAAPELPATALAYYCYQHMFNGCTSLTTAPELPATAVTAYCYNSMFNGCTSLTTLPELPATILAYYCYANMFLGCTNIKLSETQTGEYQTEYRIPTSGEGTGSSFSTGQMFGNTGGIFTGTPDINKTYYTSNQVI